MIKKKILLSIGASVLLNSTPALTSQSKKLSNIVVTAQKTEENIQKVPMSVNVLDEFSINDNSIQDTTDIAAYIPNFELLPSGSRAYFSRIAMRGISNTGIGDPAVALYIDDISHTDLYGFHAPLYDIQRIEVLKGPQGTLYGKNTEAGVINIITKKATNTVESQISLEAGDHDKRSVFGYINGPIIKDKLFMKLSGIRSSKNGYIDNKTLNSKIAKEDTTSFRGSLIYKVNDNLDLNLIATNSKLEDKGGFPMTPVDKSTYANALGLGSIGEFEIANDEAGESLAKTKSSVFKVNYNLDNKYDFVSVTGYRDMDNVATLDGDFTPTAQFKGLNDRKSTSVNQEFRISAQESDNFKWLLGAFYGEEDIEFTTAYIFGQAMGAMAGAKDIYFADHGSKDMALFGQSTYKVLDNKLAITAGLRYEKSERTMDNRTHKTAGVDRVPMITGKKKDDNRLLPKLMVDYSINQDSMIYTSVAKGYKAGGYSFVVDNEALNEFNPEVSTAYEIGYKSNFPDLGVIFNISAFYTKVDDYQDRLQIDPATVIQANASKVDIKGLEIESSYSINDNLTLSGNLGFISAKYGDYKDTLSNANYKDNHVALIPKHDLSLALKYRTDNGIFANFEVQNTGKKYFDRSNSKETDGYTIYNTKVGYEQEKWDIYLTVKNITDKEYHLDGINMGNIGYIATAGEARSAYITFNYRF